MTRQQELELIAEWLGAPVKGAMKHAAYQVCLMAAKEWKEGKE